MSIFLQVLLTGIAMGFIYALVGIEYTIIWNATGLLNFSHDKFIMLSAFVFAGTYVLGLGLPEPLAILFALITMFLFGAFVALVIFNPLSKYSTNLFATIGTVILGRIITEAVRLIWGPMPFGLNNFLKGTYKLGEVVIGKSLVVIIIVCSIVTLALTVFLKNTKTGKSMRAVANNKYAASLMGIHVPMNIAFTIGLSAAICTSIGVLIVPLYNVQLSMTGMIGLKGLCAGVIGGFGYLPGAIVGGLVLGVVENMASMVLPSLYKDCISFVLLILFMLFRPSGIMGHRKDS